MLKNCNYKLKNGNLCKRQVWAGLYCGQHQSLLDNSEKLTLQRKETQAKRNAQKEQDKLLNSLHNWLK